MDTHIINIANELADCAGDIARRYFRQPLENTFKAGNYPVTTADLAIETSIRALLNQKLPEHSILGEEYGLQQTSSEYLWVLDPIDGTTSFACGKPSFCTLIALLIKGSPVLGIIDQPITQERWIATQGSQTMLNGKPCRTNPAPHPDPLRLSCTTPLMFTDLPSQQTFHKVQQYASITSFGGDAYTYGLLASGHVEVILEADLKFYDVAALIPIIEGAGGALTDWQGQAINYDTFTGQCLAAANKTLQKNVLQLIHDN